MTCARTLWMLALAALSGCAPTARMQVFRPALHDLSGIERVVIIDAAPADVPATGHSAGNVREAVVASFVANRSYTLVEPAVLEGIQPIRAADGTADRQAVRQAAWQAGVDALLEFRQSPEGLLQAELIDVDSAAVVAAPSARTPDDLVVELAPHYVPEQVTLARQWWGEGRTLVAAGNALALQGDWTGAEEKWKLAREANPANHAALHNLALAAEARRDYHEATKLLDQALAQFPARLYHQTHKAIAARHDAFVAAATQVRAIRAAAQARHGAGRAATLPAAAQAQ